MCHKLFSFITTTFSEDFQIPDELSFYYLDTTRGREEGEIDGVDYYFVSKHQFATMVTENRFLEHGEYDKQMYGTSTSSIRSIVNSAKVGLLLFSKFLFS